MSEIAVVVPVLGRPHRVEPLLESLDAAREAVSYRALFVASPSDRDEVAALRAAGAAFLVAPWDPGPGDWARKINLAYREATDEPWIFTGADDLDFRPGWADRALECGEDERVGVVGTNDLGNPAVLRGKHSTHSLVRRRYADEFGTVDERGKVLHEGYDHQFPDTELVATAIWRGAWHFCAAAVIEHLHPHWRKGALDATYRKGLARFNEDRRLFQQRQRLWAAFARVR